MNPDRRTLFGAVVVALTLLLIAGGMALAQDSGSSPLDFGDDDDSITASNVSLTFQDAIDIATAEVDGSVKEVELESEDGTPAYEVELVASNGSETEVTVHADDGTVHEIESEDEEDEAFVAAGNVSLSFQDAIDIATAEVDGSVTEVELESEDGTPVYEVEIVATNGSETEVTVHADDGTVLEIETEDEEDEHEEDEHEEMEEEREHEEDEEDEHEDDETEEEDEDE